jgi:ketosteroid isomerase-like protein
MKHILAIFISLLLQVVPIELFAESSNSDEKAIIQQRQISNKSLAEQDIEAFLGTLMPDYHVVTAANYQLSGHQAQREMMQRVFTEYPDASYVRSPVKLDFNPAQDTAAETGAWAGKWTRDGRQVQLQGSYFAKWRKVQDRWLLQAEIFVTL